LIAHWPAGIEREGAFVRRPGHIVDLMATTVDLAGATYPDSANGREIRPMQGVSLAPAFQGRTISREKPLFFEHRGNRALRDGRWKAVVAGASGAWELYDMEADRTETNDLSEKHPEQLKEMRQRWESMARRYNAIPWPYGGKYEQQSTE
jgi:arylsulfatase